MVIGVLFGILMIGIGSPSEEEREAAEKSRAELKNVRQDQKSLVDELAMLNITLATTNAPIEKFQEREKLRKSIEQLDERISGLVKSSRLAASAGKQFVIAWIQPWGKIFVNLLKLIVIKFNIGKL